MSLVLTVDKIPGCRKYFYSNALSAESYAFYVLHLIERRLDRKAVFASYGGVIAFNL